jgi:hypothetical protein
MVEHRHLECQKLLNLVDEAIACSDRPAVPLLPKAALISLFSPTQGVYRFVKYSCNL